MRPWCRIFAAWMIMFMSPFYGDIISTSAQMSLKTGISLVTNSIVS
ncbi:MAG: hypothetical protein ABI342_08480 [Nitrososphaera sp.]|jgi:hypothetical protein|nr:hypothetical protein [Candidatus Nitrosotalea sinensis]